MDVNKYLELSQKKELANTLGYEVIRDILVPELIGDNHNILYWAGKRLAREIYLAKDDDLTVFFIKAGWGNLKRIKSNKKQQLFELSGDAVQLRNEVSEQADFLLEAGFLAETIQLQSDFVCEAIIKDIKKKNSVVSLLVQLDPGDPIDIALLPEKEPLHFSE
ncbi:YslB family protein [Liquorilactobacillus mali]|uniref:YslB family protein n=1 Tax=Liquorilactobacillus mali TaxID=1618 RepID=UPI002955A06B|nr:YslB family protein [Liquorilactobacillus mali]MDV7756849.1 DUF2507 domain-containing protein [Liquorilactobacillus mali]